MTQAARLEDLASLARRDPDRAAFDLLDEIIELAEKGVISPITAQRYASRLGTGDLHEGFPVELIFSPKKKDPLRWSLAMATMWVATRSLERVREISDDVRRETSGWIPKSRSIAQVRDHGFEFGPLPPLAIRDLVTPDDATLDILVAAAALWSSLLDERLIAMSGDKVIPAELWKECTEGIEPGTLVRATQLGTPLYERVWLDALALRKVFPASRHLPAIPPEAASLSTSTPLEALPNSEVMRAIHAAVLQLGEAELGRVYTKKQRNALIAKAMRQSGYNGRGPVDRSFQRFFKIFRWS